MAYANPDRFSGVPDEVYGVVLDTLGHGAMRPMSEAHRRGHALVDSSAERARGTDWEAFKTYYVRRADDRAARNEAVDILSKRLLAFMKDGPYPHDMRVNAAETEGGFGRIYFRNEPYSNAEGQYHSEFLADDGTRLTFEYYHDHTGFMDISAHSHAPGYEENYVEIYRGRGAQNGFDCGTTDEGLTLRISEAEAAAKLRKIFHVASPPHGLEAALGRPDADVRDFFLGVLSVIMANQIVSSLLGGRWHGGQSSEEGRMWESQGMEAVFGRIVPPSFPLGAVPFSADWNPGEAPGTWTYPEKHMDPIGFKLTFHENGTVSLHRRLTYINVWRVTPDGAVPVFDLDPNHRVYNLAEDGLELKFHVRESMTKPAVIYTFVFRDIDGSLQPHYVHKQ